MDTRKWEYRLIDLPRGMTPTFDIEILLDSFGSEGWELCGIEYGSFILKREVE